jgi:hypothetical protein
MIMKRKRTTLFTKYIGIFVLRAYSRDCMDRVGLTFMKTWVTRKNAPVSFAITTAVPPSELIPGE